MTQVSVKLSKADNTFATTVKEHVNEEKSDSEVLLPNTNIITHCIYTNDYDRLKRYFQDGTDPYKDEVNDLMNKRDLSGKSPLDLTASLGRSELAKLLIEAGADINSFTSKGYSCLHHAAAWGRLQVLQMLVENSGGLQQRTVNGETPRDLAVRYSQVACFNFLEIAEEKQKLQAGVTSSLGRIQDMDKTMVGKITREEKNRVVQACKGKQEWLNNNNNNSTEASEFRSQHSELMRIVEPVLAKLCEPPA